MITKRLIVCSLIVGSIAPAFALVTLDPGSEAFATLTVGVQENDNIFLSDTNTKSAAIFDAAPGVLFDFGQASDFTGQASFSEDFLEYSGVSGLDTQLANLNLTSRYDDSMTKVSIDGWFRQANQATRDIRNNQFLVLRDLSHAAIIGENKITDKTSISLGAIYDDTDYRRNGYTDWQWVEVPVNVYYQVEPKLDLSAGFQYKNNQLGAGGVNSDEYYYNIGARGELAPKLTGQFSIGYDESHLSGGRTLDNLGLIANFNYSVTEKTTLTVGGFDGYGYAADGSGFKNASVNAGLNSAVSDQIVLGASLSYGNYDYTTRSQTDNFWQGQLNATYVYSKMISATASYAYANDNSNLAGASFSNNIFALSVSFKY
ncbi:MAG TPA: outer membrane beta-barrel protein [Opitutaceae bacterium]|jgi:hypothetical protein